MVVTEILVLLVPIFLAVVMAVFTGSGMLAGATGYLILSFLAINSGNSILMGAFVLVTTFMSLAVGVYLTSMVLGDT